MSGTGINLVCSHATVFLHMSVYVFLRRVCGVLPIQSPLQMKFGQ